MFRRSEPKLVIVLKRKLENLQNADDSENRAQIISEALQILSCKLVTFGPILKVISEEYCRAMKEYRKDILIEQKRREL